MKELGAKEVVARASQDVQAKFLRRVGADEVVYPEKQLASWTAIRYSSDHIFDYIELANGYAIFEIAIPEHWRGRTIGDIDIRRKYNVNIMALKEEGILQMTVSSATRLSESQTMLVLGNNKDIQKCFHI